MNAHAAARPDAGADPAVVTAKAFLRAGALLGLPQAVLARILGVSGPTLSRLAARRRGIDPHGKEGEHALLFLRCVRSLDALLGGNAEQCRAWLHAANAHLGARPLDLVQTSQGLVHVADYLDAMRGQG